MGDKNPKKMKKKKKEKMDPVPAPVLPVETKAETRAKHQK